MRRSAHIKSKEFNIEGAIYTGEYWLLFNRGKGKSNRNVIFTVKGNNLTDQSEIQFTNIKLPKINGFHAGFSDAILVDDKIYFLATAENSTSVDTEGRILGSILGRIDRASMKLEFTSKISDSQKFEGITLFSSSVDKIEFLLCEDSDTDVLRSDIYKLTVFK